jgi:hypothetical protein
MLAVNHGLFMQMDHNHDGHITVDEMTHFDMHLLDSNSKLEFTTENATCLVRLQSE